MTEPPALSEGALLGGRVVYRQPVLGYRTGIEPVLLAASVPARPGELVLEAGTGAGAGLLCLRARVAGIAGAGLERDPAMARLAADNFAANGFDGLSVWCEAVEAWRPAVAYDHAFANPPWHAAASTPSPDAARRRAKTAVAGLLGRWIASLATALRPRGTLAVIVPAAQFGEAAQAMREWQCMETTLIPLWPRQGSAAKLVILRGVRGGKGGSRVQPGLVLHEPGGGYTAAAERILRDGAALDL